MPLLRKKNKTKVMLITNRQKWYNLQNDNLLLNSSGVDLKLSCNEKILGVPIEENFNLEWSFSINNISKKIASSLWLLSQIKSFLSADDKLILQCIHPSSFGILQCHMGKFDNFQHSKSDKVTAKSL